MALLVTNLPANAGGIRDAVSISGSRRSPGEENGNPLQYSCLQNPMDRGAWRATVHGVAKSQTQPKRLSIHPAKTQGSNLGLLHCRQTFYPLSHQGRPIHGYYRKCIFWTEKNSWILWPLFYHPQSLFSSRQLNNDVYPQLLVKHWSLS